MLRDEKCLGMGSVNLELVEEDERRAGDLLVDKHTEDTHHGGSAVVELLGSEVDLVRLRSGEGSESNREFGGGEISREGSLLLLPGDLKETSHREDGDEINGINLEDGGMSSGEVFASGESGSRPGGGVSPGGHHSNASVLQLNKPEAVESGLVTVSDVSEGIPAAELGTGSADLVFERVEGGGGLSGLAGAKAAAEPRRAARKVSFIIVRLGIITIFWLLQ